jgi:dienelactone hydrolase
MVTFRKIISILVVILAFWLVISCFIFINANLIIYHPQYSAGTKSLIQGEHVNQKTNDGNMIEMVWNQSNISDQVFVYTHGNGGQDARIPEAFSTAGSVLSVSYPGYYTSSGTPSTLSINNSLEAGIEWLKSRGIEENRITLVGHSLGGSPATIVAHKYPNLKKLILINTFSSMKSMCEIRLKIFCVFGGGIHPTDQFAEFVEIPVVQFHCKTDETIPFEEGKKLFSHFTTKDKKFVEMNGCDHNNFDLGVVIEKAIKEGK